MRFADGNGRPVKVRIQDLTVAFAYRGPCLIMTFEAGRPRQPLSPVWANGKAEMTSDTSFLCMTKGEAMAALTAIVRTLELTTGHRLENAGPRDDSIDRVYRFVKPETTKEG